MTHKDTDTQNRQPQWGARFKAAREAMNLSEKDVASRLHLKSHIIGLIENEAFEEGPPAIFMRGYIRSYGRLLNFSEKDIDQALHQLALENPQIKTSNSTHIRPRQHIHHNNNSNYSGLTTSLIVLVLVALVGMWWNNHPRFNHADMNKSLAQPIATNQIENNQVATIPPPPPTVVATPPANPSDPMPKELADKQPAPTEDTAATLAQQQASPDSTVTPPPQIASQEPTPAPETVVPENSPFSNPIPPVADANLSDNVPDPLATPQQPTEVKKKPRKRMARRHEQEYALPEAGLEGDIDSELENSGNLY